VDDDNDSRDDGILLLRHKQEEVIAPYFIDLALELSQFTSWCSQECHVINTITRTCKSVVGLQRNPSRGRVLTDKSTISISPTVITAEEILLQQASVNNRRKTRPQPWQYGDDYLGKENEVS
jgi:hypothetical protein